MHYIYVYITTTAFAYSFKVLESVKVTSFISIFVSVLLRRLKMAIKQTYTLFVFVVILMAVMSPLVVQGRILSDDFADKNNLATYSSLYEKTKNEMSFWLQRLASGPSPRGPGH